MLEPICYDNKIKNFQTRVKKILVFEVEKSLRVFPTLTSVLEALQLLMRMRHLSLIPHIPKQSFFQLGAQKDSF